MPALVQEELGCAKIGVKVEAAKAHMWKLANAVKVGASGLRDFWAVAEIAEVLGIELGNGVKAGASGLSVFECVPLYGPI